MSTICQEKKIEKYAGYLFVYFIGEQENGEEIYFSLSEDGLHWKDLNGGQPVLLSTIGEKGVRDPFIIRSPKKDKFYIIATDLRIASGKGWGVAQYSGSKSVIIWESKDLINWSEARSSEVGIPEAGCVWAPEAIYDHEKEEYLMYWASMVKEEGDSQAKQRIYCSRTKDFKTFTPAEKYIERESHVIDTTMIKVKDVYYRFSKDETTKNITEEQSKSLDRDSFSSIESPVLEGIKGVEGPTAFKFNDKEEWCLMVDQYAAGKGYLPLLTGNLGSGEFNILDAADYSLGDNIKRHGSILNIKKHEYDMLLKKFGK